MTNNPTIDGVSQVSFRQVLAAYDYANSHPHKYLRGTTNWCAAVACKLNELLHSPDACRCRRFGKDNPHWPCPVHSAQGDPTSAMTEAGCQAYMDADGMIGIMRKSSMGHAYIAMRALDPELSALQSRIDQLEAEAMYAAATYQAARARIEELESGRGEPVGYGGINALGGMMHNGGYLMVADKPERYLDVPLYKAPPAPVAAIAAIHTLEGKGYTYGGSQLWKPPLGKKPDFDLIDQPKGSGSLDFDGLLAEFHSAVWEAAADEDSKTDYDLAGIDIAKQLQAMYRDKPVQPSAGDDPITIEAVAVVREGDDGLYLEWTLEGGIAALESAGMVLFACPEANDMCVEEGSCEIYLQPVDLDATEQRGFIRGMKAENNANHELRHQLDDYVASLQVERDELQNLLQLLDQTPLDEWYRKSLNVKVAESLRKLKNNPKPLTYYSSQATKCAGCMVHKHTPLRVDQMGGYVCLTCILNELLRLLAEESARDAEPDWEGFEEISDLPRVQEALTNFSADSTGDNGIAVVQAIALATTRKPSE